VEQPLAVNAENSRVKVQNVGEDSSVLPKDCLRIRRRRFEPPRSRYRELIKVGAKVFSAHTQGHLCHRAGNVPARLDYVEAIPLKGNAVPLPFAE
jgi:hypothetical protein